MRDEAFARPVALLGIDQLVAWGALYYAFNVLSPSMANDLRISERATSAGFSLSLLLSGLFAAKIGGHIDRHGPRGVLLTGALLGSGSVCLLARVGGLTSLLVVMALFGAAQCLALYEPAFCTVVGWFPREPTRSRALLLLTIVAGFSSTVFIPVSSLFLAHFGWRTAALALGGILLGVCLPLRWSLTQRAHHALSHRRRNSSSPLVERAPILLLGLTFAFQAFSTTGVTVRLLWHLQERGIALLTASFLAGLVGACQVPGRLMMLPLDRFLPPNARLPSLLLMQAFALLGVALGRGPSLIASLVVFGAASGMMTLARPSVIGAWFGAEGFGARNGQIATLGAIARAASPFCLELIHGQMTYRWAFALMAVGLVCGALSAVWAARLHYSLRASLGADGALAGAEDSGTSRTA